MIEKFLNAKHWQLFTLMFGIPIIFQIIVMILMFSNIGSNGIIDEGRLLFLFKLFPFIIIFYIAIHFGWFWSIGIGLQKYISVDISMKIKKFKIFFFIPLFYIVFLVTAIGISLYGFSPGSNSAVVIRVTMLFILLPLHLFSMFCMFYQLYFVSKTIKTTELGRAVTFSDFTGEFFMIWFLPIGIWYIQPRLNKIISLKNTNGDNG